MASVDHLTDRQRLLPGAIDGIADQGSVVTIPIATLRGADSPRLGEPDAGHVARLLASDTELPPIIVHRASMRVIDGVHRLRALTQRGQTRVSVRFFDGDEKSAFVLAVRTNVAHGLPLSLAERTAAAARIIASFPAWSNRSIASITSVSDNTVGAIRRRISDRIPQVEHRIGRDGRERPLSAADGRLRAGALLAKNPSASLREIARLAGVSPGTVRNVRQRLHRGEDLVPARQARNPGDSTKLEQPAPVEPVTDRRNPRTVVQAMSTDPSLRFTESGKTLLRWLHLTAAGVSDWPKVVDHVPRHSSELVADLARQCADAWLELAAELDQRVGRSSA